MKGVLKKRRAKRSILYRCKCIERKRSIRGKRYKEERKGERAYLFLMLLQDDHVAKLIIATTGKCLAAYADIQRD